MSISAQFLPHKISALFQFHLINLRAENQNFRLLNILQDSSFSNQITLIFHIHGVFNLPGKEKKLTLETKLFTSLSREEQQNVTCHIAHVSESTHEKTKWRHQQQIHRLETKRESKRS